MAAEFPGDRAAQTAALDSFDNRQIKARIPSPALRAAYTGLEINPANRDDAATNRFLFTLTSSGNPKFNRLVFTTLPPETIATTDDAGTIDTEQVNIYFNSRYAAEDPFLFTHWIAHELVHGDGINGGYEEAAARAFDNLIYLQQLVKHRKLARSHTALARLANTEAMARLNSGLGADLGLFESNAHRQVFPGSSAVTARSWWEFVFNGDTNVTAGNELYAKYLEVMHQDGKPACSAIEFNEALLRCVSQGQGMLTNSELIAAADALELDTSIPNRAAPAKCAPLKGPVVSHPGRPIRQVMIKGWLTAYVNRRYPRNRVFRRRVLKLFDNSEVKRLTGGRPNLRAAIAIAEKPMVEYVRRNDVKITIIRLPKGQRVSVCQEADGRLSEISIGKRYADANPSILTAALTKVVKNVLAGRLGIA
jgi:hypothetical protein